MPEDEFPGLDEDNITDSDEDKEEIEELESDEDSPLPCISLYYCLN